MVKVNILSINLVVILIVALAHTFVHYSMFSSDSVSEAKGISGFSVTNVDPEKSGTFSLSLLIIGFEWATLIFVLIFSLTREKINTGEETEINIDKEKMKSIAKSGTEMDMLYELLKNNHSLKLSMVQKLFEVDKEKVMSWGRTLSEANLISINYPNIGEPELVVK